MSEDEEREDYLDGVRKRSNQIQRNLEKLRETVKVGIIDEFRKNRKPLVQRRPLDRLNTRIEKRTAFLEERLKARRSGRAFSLNVESGGSQTLNQDNPDSTSEFVICPACGAKVSKAATFCPSCGGGVSDLAHIIPKSKKSFYV